MTRLNWVILNYRNFLKIVWSLEDIAALHILNSAQWVKLHSNLTVCYPRQMDWWNFHAVHEVLKSIQIWCSCLGKIKTSQRPIKLFPIFFPSNFHCLFVCLCVCFVAHANWSGSDWAKCEPSQNRTLSPLRFPDWQPTSAFPGVACCWQGSMLPCSLPESWHWLHSTVAHNSHAIALLHRQ